MATHLFSTRFRDTPVRNPYNTVLFDIRILHGTIDCHFGYTMSTKLDCSRGLLMENNVSPATICFSKRAIGNFCVYLSFTCFFFGGCFVPRCTTSISHAFTILFGKTTITLLAGLSNLISAKGFLLWTHKILIISTHINYQSYENVTFSKAVPLLSWCFVPSVSHYSIVNNGLHKEYLGLCCKTSYKTSVIFETEQLENLELFGLLKSCIIMLRSNSLYLMVELVRRSPYNTIKEKLTLEDK